MTLLKSRDIAKMPKEERDAKLLGLQTELFHERGQAAMGGAPPNPGRIRALRTEIARVLTVESSEGN